MARTTRSPNPFKDSPYLPYISKAELNGLRKMPLADLDQEIGALRISIGRLMKLGLDEQDVEAQTRIARGVALLVNALNTSLRTRDLLFGSYSPLDEALKAALHEEPFYLSGPPPEPSDTPPVEPTGAEAERWRQVFALEPGRQPGRSRRR